MRQGLISKYAVHTTTESLFANAPIQNTATPSATNTTVMPHPEINYSPNTEKPMYTPHKKGLKKTSNKTVLVSPIGKVFAVGKSRHPKHDLTNTVMQDFLQVLLKVEEDEAIGGDAAYVGS